MPTASWLSFVDPGWKDKTVPTRISLIGGGQDGREVVVDVPTVLGAELRVSLGHDKQQCEVYKLMEDGRFHFAGYSHPTSQPALEEALRPIIARVGAALMELDAVYASIGQQPTPLRVNDWFLNRLKDGSR